MSDSLGGTVVIVIIVVFITLVSGYMAFNINYTKAFKMKNKIIDTYEKYNGACNTATDCNKEIENYAKEIGYNTERFNCSKGTAHGTIGKYCVYEVTVASEYSDSDKNAIFNGNDFCDDYRKYYEITTKPETPKIPIFYYFFRNTGYFSVSGNTKILCNDG